VSRQAAFVVVVALRATQVLDRLFGPKLLAKDAIATAASLTIGSWYLLGALLTPRGWADAAAAVAVLACAALGPRYRFVQNKALLNAAGATLAGIAITGDGWQTILKHFGVA
jgi:hypothetical protein